MVYLTEAQILLIHSMVIDETGGAHGVRDYHAILSLVNLPKQKAFGKELYPTIFIKTAVYARNIITAHPFIDGNKRAGITAASVFLENNGYKIIAKEGEIEKFALKIIVKKLNLGTIAKWFKKHSKKM
ncbi:MAG: type II toxin-antitoxin system death-on-curing family toxin [Candidatus Paceibacterota bacterium]